MRNLIGMELLTALSSGLSYSKSGPNMDGDNLPTWLYFDRQVIVTSKEPSLSWLLRTFGMTIGQQSLQCVVCPKGKATV